MNARLQLIGLTIALMWLAACGAPGSPQPPSLELPRSVQDVAATRKGDHVYLSWTAPTQTTDGQNVRAAKLGPAQVCRATEYPMASCAQVAGSVPAAQIPLAKPGQQAQKVQFTDTLTRDFQQQHSTGFATYAVSVLNWRDRSAGLSNQVRVPLAPVDPPPQQVFSEVTSGSVALWWPDKFPISTSGDLRRSYRVYRREGSGSPVPVTCGPVELPGRVLVDSASCGDANFEWEKTYTYRVTPVAIVAQNGQKLAEVEGDDSPEVKVFTRDIFPPAQPGGLQAVFSGVGQKPFMDLTWAPNTDADLAGYNVYRNESGQPPVKINTELIPTPSFRDDNVQPGRTYYYSLSAVDVRGNESGHSEETSEKVPE